MKYLKITKYAILIYEDLKGKFMFFMLFFTYYRYFKRPWSRAGERKDDAHTFAIVEKDMSKSTDT